MSRSPKTKGLRDAFSITPKEMVWRDNASCKSLGLVNFFSTPMSSGLSVALACCRFCPVRTNCLHEAMTFGYHGVWGGSTYEQRSAIVKILFSSDLTEYTMEDSAEMISVIDSIGRTKDTASADLYNNYTKKDSQND